MIGWNSVFFAWIILRISVLIRNSYQVIKPLKKKSWKTVFFMVVVLIFVVSQGGSKPKAPRRIGTRGEIIIPPPSEFVPNEYDPEDIV